MTSLTKKIIGFSFLFFFSLVLAATLQAQTPATFDPGIGGPIDGGVGSGDGGGPIIPFDGGMSLMLLASGVGYASDKLRKNGILKSK